jgi:cysteine desulfurase/selenocysteine lyase
MSVVQQSRIELGQAVKGDFPILSVSARGKPLVYLDNAATSQKPLAVIEALDSYWTEANANVHRGVHFLSERATERFETARETVRRFVNALEADEIIFTKGCSEGINLVATCLQRHSAGVSARSTKGGADPASPLSKIAPGDVILVSTMEHHSNIVPWQMLAQQTGAIVKPIPVTEVGEIDLEAYEQLLRENPVKVLAIVHISNSIGTINPVKQMVAMAHKTGALALVDGAQAGPHWLVDVQYLDADFYTLSCHKIYAPTGIGVLYGKRHLLEALPAYQGGGSMIRTVSFEETTYAEIPAKFEPGTPNIAGVVGLGAAIEYLEELGARNAERGIETQESAIPNSDLRAPSSNRGPIQATMNAIHEHELVLAKRATQLLSEIPGVNLIGTAMEKAGIVSFTINGVHPHDIGSILDGEGIAIRAGHHCCMPLMSRYGIPATARASFALYNTLDEADALAAGVRKVKEMFT